MSSDWPDWYLKPTKGWKKWDVNQMNEYYQTKFVSQGPSGIKRSDKSPTGWVAVDLHGDWRVYSVAPSASKYDEHDEYMGNIVTDPFSEDIALSFPMDVSGLTPTAVVDDDESVASNDPYGEHDPFDDPADDRGAHHAAIAAAVSATTKAPGSETETKRDKKQNPFAGFRGDFAGLVSTFLNPVTSRIIGYKGIPRKRKFSVLQRYSPFWKEQMRLTQTSVLAGPFSP